MVCRITEYWETSLSAIRI